MRTLAMRRLLPLLALLLPAPAPRANRRWRS